MLNVQKRCFEEELESLESEAHSTVLAFERQFAALRDDVAAKDEEHARERDAAYAKIAAVMDAVKKRIEQADARVVTMQKQRDSAVIAAKQRHELLGALARERAAAFADAEAVRMELSRKNRLVDQLQHELADIASALAVARAAPVAVLLERNSNTRNRPAARLARDSNVSAPENARRLGDLLASVIADFANAHSEVGHEPVDTTHGEAGAEHSESTSLRTSGVASARA